MSSDVGVCQLHKNANSYVAGHANSVQDMQRRRNGNGAERKRQWQARGGKGKLENATAQEGTVREGREKIDRDRERETDRQQAAGQARKTTTELATI